MAASDDSDVSTGPAADHPRTPVTAWLRPVLVLLGGMAVAALLAWNDQLILAVPLALLTLLMAYWTDRKSTRLNSSHVAISYAVFCLKKKIQQNTAMTGHE